MEAENQLEMSVSWEDYFTSIRHAKKFSKLLALHSLVSGNSTGHGGFEE